MEVVDIAIAFLLNIGAGIVLFTLLFLDILASSNPATVMVGLFILPILYVLVLVTMFLWWI